MYDVGLRPYQDGIEYGGCIYLAGFSEYNDVK